jgi:ABC-2 type transport system permease protein
VVVELLGALTALGTGIVLSLFATNEFQAIQFIPVVITPQVVLGETFRPVSELPAYLEYPALAMPVTPSSEPWSTSSRAVTPATSGSLRAH